MKVQNVLKYENKGEKIMKGKLTGKIFNLRNIIVILSILIMAVGSGISIVEYNGKNVQTVQDL